MPLIFLSMKGTLIMEVPKITGFYARPLIEGKNQYYYTFNNGQWVVMKRFKTKEPKIYSTYKTERGAKNCAYSMLIS